MNFLPEVEESCIHVMLVNVYETYLGPDIHDYFRFQDALFDEGLSVVVANFTKEQAALSYARRQGISVLLLGEKDKKELKVLSVDGKSKDITLSVEEEAPQSIAEEVANMVRS